MYRETSAQNRLSNSFKWFNSFIGSSIPKKLVTLRCLKKKVVFLMVSLAKSFWALGSIFESFKSGNEKGPHFCNFITWKLKSLKSILSKNVFMIKSTLGFSIFKWRFRNLLWEYLVELSSKSMNQHCRKKQNFPLFFQ